ncbi:MAG: MaoC/PaaZ C-terminal domain-containing protein [Bryobacterales bacterium]|nr:MaoC/PaaZ C-terminal domain-containing protein [Bryobacterales bacterium]
MDKRSFEAIETGEEHETPGVTVTDWHVMNFAAVSMDFFELHTNEEYARESQFGRRVAHGLLGLAMADGLKHRSSFQIEAIASLHWSWEFCGPIHIGDTIRARLRVAGKRASRSKPDRGVVTVRYQVLNQHGDIVQRGENKVLVRRRQPPSTGPAGAPDRPLRAAAR